MKVKTVSGIMSIFMLACTVALSVGVSVREAKRVAKAEVHTAYLELQEQVKKDVGEYLTDTLVVSSEGFSAAPVVNASGQKLMLSKEELDNIVTAVADTVEYNLIRDLVLQNTVATEQSMQQLEASVAQRIERLIQNQVEINGINEQDKNLIIDTVSAIVKSDTLKSVSQISESETTKAALSEEKLEARLDMLQGELQKQKSELEKQEQELSKQNSLLDKQDEESGLQEEKLVSLTGLLNIQSENMTNMSEQIGVMENQIDAHETDLEDLRKKLDIHENGSPMQVMDQQIQEVKQSLDVNYSGSPIQVLDTAINQLGTDVTALNEEVFGNGTENGLVGAQYRDTTQYQKGDLVLRNAKLYKCISNQSVSGVWDSTKWQQVSLTELIAQVQEGQLKVQSWDAENGVLYLMGE